MLFAICASGLTAYAMRRYGFSKKAIVAACVIVACLCTEIDEE
jgi:branched-subunit amino acid permease